MDKELIELITKINTVAFGVRSITTAQEIAKGIEDYYSQQAPESLLLTDEEEDNCYPTNEQLEKYSGEPDDEIAADIRKNHPEKFNKIIKQILWGKNIAKAQLVKATAYYEAKKSEGRMKQDNTTIEVNHKGLSCPIKPIICQEGYCSECEIWRRKHG
jgi:hypothetical protein